MVATENKNLTITANKLSATLQRNNEILETPFQRQSILGNSHSVCSTIIYNLHIRSLK